MNTTTKVLSIATVMVAMTGMIGISFDQVYATQGVGKGGFQLNIIGVDISKGNKNADDGQIPNDANNGHRIFVNLNGHSKIFLQEDTDETPEVGFAVIDADATDKDGAIFQLPPPNSVCLDENGIPQADQSPEALAVCDNLQTAYGVFARILGKPGGNIQIATCAEVDLVDLDNDGTDEEICSVEKLDMTRKNSGKPVWDNVSRELLTVCVDVFDDTIDPETGEPIGFDGICDIRVDIFDDQLENYFWSVTNEGAKLLQLRIIDSPTVDPL